MGVFICLGCQNKAPQPRWLKQQKLIFLTILKARSLRWSCQRGLVPSEAALPALPWSS